MSKSDRMEGEDRAKLIAEAGAKLAGKYGAVNVTRKMVAKEAKVSVGLVSHYMGTTEEAQKTYAKTAKKLGIVQPDKATIATLGAKLRAHGPRKEPVKRTRSAKEKAAIKRNVAAKAKPSVTTKGKVTTVKTRKSGGDARDVPVPALGGKTLRQVKDDKALNKRVAKTAAKLAGKTAVIDDPGSSAPAVIAPVAPKKTPAKKTAARAPLAAPTAPVAPLKPIVGLPPIE